MQFSGCLIGSEMQTGDTNLSQCCAAEARVSQPPAKLWQHLYVLQNTVYSTSSSYHVHSMEGSCKECKVLENRQKYFHFVISPIKI